MDAENQVVEWLKAIAAYIVPIASVYFTYHFAIRGKQKDSDIQRRYELNNVLSQMLIIRHYLVKLEAQFNIKFDNTIALPIAKEYIPYFLLNSGLINNNHFTDLEKAVANLKRYDPISYYELEGVGDRLEFLKKSFIIPFSKSRSTSPITKKLSDKYLTEAITEIEDHILTIAGRIDDTMVGSVKEKLQRNPQKDKDDFIREVTELFYDLYLKSNPDLDITIDQFTELLKTEELQEIIKKQCAIFFAVDFQKLLEAVVEDPTISEEHLLKRLNIASIQQ